MENSIDERQPLIMHVPQMPQPPKTDPPQQQQNQNQFQHHQFSSPFQPTNMHNNPHFMVPVALENGPAIITVRKNLDFLFYFFFFFFCMIFDRFVKMKKKNSFSLIFWIWIDL